MFQPITDTTHFAEYHDRVELYEKHHQKRTTNFYKVCAVSLFVQCVLLVMFTGYWFLLFWMLALAVHAGIAVLAMHARPEKPRNVIWFYAAMAAASVLFLFNLVAAVAGVILYVPAIKESRKAVWLSQQPGYPYFNARFMLQQDHYLEDYPAEHDFSERLGDEMFAIEENEAEMEAHAQKSATEALLMQDADIPTESK